MSDTDDRGTLPELVPLDFEVDSGFGERARIGLIVLETDQTIEAEARLLNLPGVAFFHSRIANEAEVTPAMLTDMRNRLPAAAALLPAGFGFDAIGYGCTSAATLIGEEEVAACIQYAHPGTPATNPISSAVTAFQALNAKRIAIVTPYSAEVTQPIVQHFADRGLTASAVGSFLELDDLVVARISYDSIVNGVRSVASRADCDAVFVSCTSLRLLEVATEIEAETGMPVVSSNMALLWHLLRLAGVEPEASENGSHSTASRFGRLFSLPLPPS